jgi:hypothetical protein
MMSSTTRRTSRVRVHVVVAAVFSALVVLLFAGSAVVAQGRVPPHAPGSLCFTPQFWCYAQPPGRVGTPCACPTPYGWVAGFRG